MKIIPIGRGFVSIPDIEAICPNCKQEIAYKQKDILTKDLFYKICKKCRKKVGITMDMKGDTVTWLKETETKSLPLSW